MDPQPDFSAFPPVPAVRAEWAPVYLEPIPGAGERITIGVAARGWDGDGHFVLQVLREAVARCMYGDHAEQILGFSRLVLESLEEYLEHGGPLPEWSPPLRGSAALGRVSIGYGDSAEDVARTGAQLAASLAWAPGARSAKAPATNAPADPDIEEWVRQIKDATVAMRQDFGPRFLHTVSLTPKAPATRIGYFGVRLAAQFGRLVPGRGLTGSYNRAKAYLTELQILRDRARGTDLLGPRPFYELMLWTPPAGSAPYSRDQREEAMGAFTELEGFGDAHELRVEAMHTAEAACARILHAEEA